MKILWGLVCLCGAVSLHAAEFDWRQIHETAAEISLAEARQQIQEGEPSLRDLYLVGLKYLDEYKAGKAAAVFSRMRERSPEMKEALWGGAEVLRRENQFKESARILEELISKHPGYAPAYISLAYIRYLEMDFRECAGLAMDVIRMDQAEVDQTNYVRAHTLFAGAKGMLAHYGGPIAKVMSGRQVMPYLKKAEEIDPDAPAVLMGLGSYYLLTPPLLGRDVEKAKRYLQQAVKEDPLFPDAYVRLGQAYRMQGNEKKYRQYLRKALELDPNHVIARDVQSGKCDFICVSGGND
ncbi:MAG: tetratricopeptide repeat protein [Candidatus Omnitrophica bacterium]|nr:tetratricopeptide repeat protein [Candidatus Omnitrophota bacterium]